MGYAEQLARVSTLGRPADRSLPIPAPVLMSPVTPAMVVSQSAGGGRGEGGGAGGHGRLGWGAADAYHGLADAARADGARADARCGGLGRGCVPPGGAGHQATAARRRRYGTTGQDQHHPTGQSSGASDRPQCQVGLMAGRCVRPPHAGSPVPRHVTGTPAHVPITPGRSRSGRHCSSGTPGNSAVSRPQFPLPACRKRACAAPTASPARVPFSSFRAGTATDWPARTLACCTRDFLPPAGELGLAS